MAEVEQGPYRWCSRLKDELLVLIAVGCIDLIFRRLIIFGNLSLACGMQQGAADHPLHVECIKRLPKGKSNLCFRLFSCLHLSVIWNSMGASSIPMNGLKRRRVNAAAITTYST